MNNSQHSNSPFSYVTALRRHTEEHPSAFDNAPLSSIVQNSLEPSNLALGNDNTSQIITDISQQLQSDQPPRGVVAQRLQEFLNSLPPDAPEVLSHERVHRTRRKSSSVSSSNSSDTFSSISQPLLSPFHQEMQRRLNKLQDRTINTPVPYYSTPHPHSSAGVNHHPSINHFREMIGCASEHNQGMIRNSGLSTVMDYSALPTVRTKTEMRDDQSVRSSQTAWPQPPIFPPYQRIDPPSPSTISSLKPPSHISSKKTTPQYYNLLSSSQLSVADSGQAPKIQVPVPKPRTVKRLVAPPIITPIFTPARVPYAGIEYGRRLSPDPTVSPVDLPSLTPIIPTSSHHSSNVNRTQNLNQTALVPAAPQTVIPRDPLNNQFPIPPQVPDVPNVSYSKLLERRYGLKPESAAALIPAFQAPCCLWADKVKRVLQARGFVDLTDPWLSVALLPFVLGKLPSNIAQMAPTVNLAYLLDFIETYDRKTNNLHDVLTKSITVNVKPSAAFLQRCTEMRRARGPDLDDDAVRQLAWQSLSNSLPSQLQSFVLTIRASNELPTPRQWEIIDNLWFDSLSKQELSNKLANPTVANVELNPTGINTKSKNSKRNNNANLTKQVNQLSEKLDRTLTQLTAGATKTSPNTPTPIKFPLTGANLSLGIALKDRGINLARYPDAPYPHRLDLCFYHQAFGKNALKCHQGCAWVNRTGKAVRQVPIPKSDPKPPPSGPSDARATAPSSSSKNA